MANNNKNQLLEYLPEAFRQDPATRDFLLAFEKILLGRVDKVNDLQDKPVEGLEQTLDGLARFFTPGTNDIDGAPDDFLPWLSQWVALSLRTDIDITKRRSFIANMAQLYRERGTKKSMEKLLEIFTARVAKVNDKFDAEPHYFTVSLNLNDVREGEDKEDYNRAEEKAHSVIRAEKPAHTRYRLIPEIDTMQIGKRLPPNETRYSIQVGRNTRLGTAKWKK